MKRTKLLVADVDETHIHRVTQCVNRTRDIALAGVCRNGCDVLKCVDRDKPDVLLMDIQLPGMDGMLLLKDMQTLAHSPAVVVCTRFYSNMCVLNASRFGARYFLYKPLDYKRLPEVLRGCAEAIVAPRDEYNRYAAARRLIGEMGIPAKLSGSAYLLESVMRLGDNENLLRNLSKGLYAEIATRMNTTPSCVERSMRNAITVAYERGSMAQRFDHRPSNRAFIQYLYAHTERQGADAPEKSAASFL